MASTLPRCGFSLAVSGSTIPPAVRSSASTGSTTTRSSNGRILILGIALIPVAECVRVLNSECKIALHHPFHASHAAHSSHATHPSHAVVVVVVAAFVFFLLGNLGDEGFGGEQQRGDARRVLQ